MNQELELVMNTLISEMGKMEARINSRLDRMEQRLDCVEQRVDQHECRIERLEKKNGIGKMLPVGN